MLLNIKHKVTMNMIIKHDIVVSCEKHFEQNCTISS